MSSSTHFHRARDWEQHDSTDNRTPAIFSNTSYQTSLPDSAGLEPGFELSDCTSCLQEPKAAECCWLPASTGEQYEFSQCTDPVCVEPECGECFENEECCDNCVLDCESDCGIPFGCDELDAKVDDAYCLEGSYSELFGDQTALTFGFGRRLPCLAGENPMMVSNGSNTTHNGTTSTLPSYNLDQSYLGSKLQPNRFSQIACQPHAQQIAPQAFAPPRSGYEFASHGSTNYELTPGDQIPLACNNTSFNHLSECGHGNLDPTDSTINVHHDHISLLTEKSDSKGPFPPSLPCQWADSNGNPCGKTLRPGKDMHEHLKSVHDVKNSQICRWIGCAVGAQSASPHKYASSVERHTWGHSGYRPYECSACHEGFAAASVRDEHFTNIHLRKKVFACDQCSHQCTSATNLKRHKYDKHSVERFQCEFCNQHGKRRLFPRGPNLARHFRNCKYVLAQFPEATPTGRVKADWLPPGYRKGHHGMDKAKVTPPNYLSVQ